MAFVRHARDLRRESGSGKLRGAGLWLGLLGMWLACGGPGRADGPADSPSAASEMVAHLQYREVDFAPVCSEVKVMRRAGFARELAYGGARLFRGQFVLDRDTNPLLPFAWDIQQRKIYLDLNHNGDLTDDPAGVLAASGRDLQLFRDIRLRFASDGATYQVLVDAHVFEQSGGARVFLYVRSLWEGAVELAGKKWYLAVIDRPDGRIGPPASLKEIGDRMILRPWADRDQPFLWWHATLRYVHALDHVKLVNFPFRYAGNAEVFDAFNLPTRLFVQGQAYRMDYHPESSGNLAAAFRAVHPPLGKLHLGGDNVRRVVLDSGDAGFTAVLDSPASEVEVPVGVYPRQIVLLQRAGFTNVAVGLGNSALAVTESNLPTLAAGGPLENAVAVSTRLSSGTVSLSYQLTNAAGISFRLAFQDERTPPRLEIRQGDSLIAQDRFEFG